MHHILNHLLALSVGMTCWPQRIDRHAQRILPQMTLDLIKWTSEIAYHTCLSIRCLTQNVMYHVPVTLVNLLEIP